MNSPLAHDKHSVLMTKLAYQHNDTKLFKTLEELPEGFELFLLSDEFKEVKGHEYRCAVIVNSNDKTIIFANAGTRIDNNKIRMGSDLFADAQLGLQFLPSK